MQIKLKLVTIKIIHNNIINEKWYHLIHDNPEKPVHLLLELLKKHKIIIANIITIQIQIL